MGISEHDFWIMTFAELDRALASRKRVLKVQAQEKASMDYILADLIGRSVGRIYSSSARYPDISAVYPSLFDDKEIKAKQAERSLELSALRFKKFADSYNKKYTEVAKDK